MEKENAAVQKEEGNKLMRKKDAALFAWPWENLGNFKACSFVTYSYNKLYYLFIVSVDSK